MLNGGGLPYSVPWCPFQEGSYTNSDKGTELAIKPHITRNKLTIHKEQNTYSTLIYIYMCVCVCVCVCMCVYCESRNHKIVTLSEKVNYYYYAQENLS
jgi:hypothetical protein